MICEVLKLSKVGGVWTNVEIIGATEFIFGHYHTGLLFINHKMWYFSRSSKLSSYTVFRIQLNHIISTEFLLIHVLAILKSWPSFSFIIEWTDFILIVILPL